MVDEVWVRKGRGPVHTDVVLSLSFTGPVRGLGVLGREHFEINPEEIHVNFSDVKGVGSQLFKQIPLCRVHIATCTHSCTYIAYVVYCFVIW